MATPGIRKFTYDTVFTADGKVTRAPEDQRVSFSPEEIQEARAQGFAQGERSAVAEAEKAAARALEAIAQQVAALTGALAGVASELRRDAVELGLAGARAAAEAAVVRCPEEAVLALLSECAESLRSAPIVTIEPPRGAPAAVIERIRAHAAQKGLAAQIHVREGGQGAARIEWSGGAAAIEPESALARAREAAERWLIAADAGADQPSLFPGR
jgi:flagellar assembly protein FliH